MTRRQIDASAPPELQLERTNEKWNRHKISVGKLPMLNRPKRVIPLLAGIFWFSVLAGTQVATVKNVRKQGDNLETVPNVVNMHSDIMRQSTELFEQYLDSISSLITWSQGVDDRLDQGQEGRFARYRGKKAGLVKTYIKWFDAQEKLLYDINTEVGKGKIPRTFNKILNISDWTEEAANLSTVFECSFRLENRSLAINLDFLLLSIDRNIEILSVIHMDHYVLTKNAEDEDQECLSQYRRPTKVLHNKTSNCLTQLRENRSYNKVVRSQTCLNENHNELYDVKFYDQN